MTSSVLNPTPWNINKINPSLHVFRQDEKNPFLLLPYEIAPEIGAKLLNENGFLSTSRVIIVVHGFRNTVKIPWMVTLKDILLNQSNQVVILLDWGDGADLLAPRYLQAAANIQTVGPWLSDYLIEIKRHKRSITIWGIGHSLGCHLLGIAGRNSGKFDRISAMDPAGPGFEKHLFLPFRLCSTDAKMVDVIHTDGYDSFFDPEDWISPVNHYGTLIPLGTIDFYPNYGYNQPGAGPITSHTIAGSHLRAIELFIWSIKHPRIFLTNKILDGIPGFESPVMKISESDTPAEMGYHCYLGSGKVGIYFLETSSEEPWVKESEFMALENFNLNGESTPVAEEIDENAQLPISDKEESFVSSYCSIF